MIDYKLEALKALDNSAEIGGAPQSAYFGVVAQVHATLHLADQVAALVEQQRIANLNGGDSDIEATLWGDHTREGLAL